MSLITNRFLALNKERLDRTMEIMPARQRPYIQLLPLLFHASDGLLPGSEVPGVPMGIYGYFPDKETLDAAKKIWRSYNYRNKPLLSYDIEAIFLMGSCGSVAFNTDSDFDVWICYRTGLDPERISRLQKKAIAIEKWYEEKGLEVHFFPMNAEAFKNGRVSKLSSESSGSAQYHLLLDEFYRTSIWMAGKKPLWWEISAEEEKVYEKSIKVLAKKGLIDLENYLDFGGLPAIPKSEFFGAAVWQIYKGIDSPYKSVLKITLMESYAESYPEISPLCAVFKKQVQEGSTDTEILDPYLMLFNRIDNYLKRKSELSRLEIARRSFYLKLSLPLSNKNEADNWRKKIIEEIVVNNWAWSPEKIERLDNQKNWIMEDVVGERKLLVSHLTNSYSFLSKFARKHASKRLIKPKDLTILGRKLYSAFDRKPGKVEMFNRGIADNMTEKSVTIRLFFGKDLREYWHLYRGKVISDQYKSTRPLKQAFSLIELLSWSYVNRLVRGSTQKLMYAPGSNLGNSELNALNAIVEKLLGKNMPMIPHSKDLLKTAIISNSAIFINLGKQSKLSGTSVEKKLIAGELDVLNYGGDHNCLVENLEYLYVTSWKEVFSFKYYHADGIASWLCATLNMYKESLGASKKGVEISSDVYSFGTGVAHILSSRINALYKSVIKTLLSDAKGQVSYIYQAAKQFYRISFDNDHFDFKKFSNTESLMENLFLPRDKYLKFIFDEHVSITLPLAEIFKTNKEGYIQLFCYEEREKIHLFVLDEVGILFHQVLPLDNCKKVLMHYQQFFEAVLNRRRIDEDISFEEDEISAPVEDILEMYKVYSAASSYRVEQVALDIEDEVQSFDIQVLAHQAEDKPIFTFYCDDIEFSSSEFGGEVFDRVASYIMDQRSGHRDYFLYITDLELSPELLGKKVSHKVQTCELLKYKKRIESRLNK